MGLLIFIGDLLEILGTISSPLSEVIKKDKVFSWEKEQDHSFNVLKEIFVFCSSIGITRFFYVFLRLNVIPLEKE